eukprot:2172094-Prymnesium_polylepis.1
MPDAAPTPWPPTEASPSICVRLLRSGSIKQKSWWSDMSRALGGRLRTFTLAIVRNSECEPETGLPTLAGITAAALLGTTLTIRLLA